MASSSRAPSLDHHFSFRFFLILISLPSFLAVAENWSVGHILSTSGPPLHSPSGDFTFGFCSLPDRETYLLSVWYTDIPDTIVWYATNQDDVMAPKGSKLTLSSSEGLVLTDPQGKEIWSSPVDAGQISHCALNDTGNLMIKSTDGNTIWQSFVYPTDTLLPTQTIDGADNEGPTLYSRLGENNFSRGRFMMRLHKGSIILNTRNPVTKNIYDVTYYDSGTGNSSGYRLSYNASGHMYVLTADGSRSVDLTQENVPTPATDYYLRATLNFDGVFTWYYHQKKNAGGDSGWTAFQSIPDNICTAITGEVDSGACGFNSICSLGSDQRPMCQCPPGYSLMDPSNTYGDCKPNFEVSACHDEHTNNSSYRLERLAHTDWPLSDYDKEVNVSEDDCKRMCLEDCFCAVAISRDQNCWKKKLPLSNGRKENSGVGTAFVKVKDADDYSNINQNASSRSSANSYGNGQGTNVLVSALLVASALFNAVLFSLIVFGIWFFYHKQRLRGGGSARFSNSNHHGEYDVVRRFTYRELEDATDGFKEELGRGACAIVYKGCYSGSRNSPNSQSYFAVKKIDSPAMKEADKEFKTEVGIIGKTHHRNLVKLIGFCEEDQHRMLVYEFMSNGSLSDLLFGELRPSWVVRMDIAKGIARGLLYLHEECATQIIHCDIKAQNILLDEAYNAKISDLGMSKLLKVNQFQTQTAVRGTKGYVAPDWFKNKAVDVKVDVYSFGVLLLEIVSCRRCIDFERCNEEEMAILTDWVIECYLSRRLADLVPNDLDAQEDVRGVERVVMVAIWCIQEDPKVRPTMRQVSQMLESAVEVPTPPCPYPNSFSITCE